ncbi:related to integral membrane protein [Cephalotrichum gorgonifer]|uniref:Related to integral membrane protein n=1 Tax=Cephalotrichum gorgonifer TaxID=2041049 RepID=A0AAE8MWU5_9PEZI|nr:related to integral membrane protein [Cephalotrichum gorgonifer]
MAQKLWWDDWMIVFSMGWNFAVVGFIFTMHAKGMGIHADLVDPEDIVAMAKWLVVAEIFYAWNLGWTKLALLIMYYRIFRVSYFKTMAWIVGAFVMAWVVCITFLFIFICVPVEKLWYPHLPGRCINQVGTWIANAASTIFTDLVILCLPLSQVWKLRLQKAEKIALTVAFSLGIFVVFASAYRTSVLFTYSNDDPTYTLAPTVGWTAIEMSAGIVSACLPTLMPVMKWFCRTIGLTSLTGTLRGMSAGDSNPKTDGSAFNHELSSRDPIQRGKVSDPKGEPFYRLPDDTDSDLADERGMGTNLTLRPDKQKFEVTINTSDSVRDRDEDSGDEVALNKIHVRKELTQTSRPV